LLGYRRADVRRAVGEVVSQYHRAKARHS
jgi:hypothetical protein